MIELNLTYEESKKILELGYDFAKVCWHSSYVYLNQYDYGKTLTQIYVHGTGLSLETIEYRVKDEVDKYGIVKDFTPIIPKAALEACLPDHTRYASNYTWAGHTSISLAYGTGEDLTIENYTTEYESAYEAFIWCHENYPEELRKKFEEVMK